MSLTKLLLTNYLFILTDCNINLIYLIFKYSIINIKNYILYIKYFVKIYFYYYYKNVLYYFVLKFLKYFFKAISTICNYLFIFFLYIETKFDLFIFYSTAPIEFFSILYSIFNIYIKNIFFLIFYYKKLLIWYNVANTTQVAFTIYYLYVKNIIYFIYIKFKFFFEQEFIYNCIIIIDIYPLRKYQNFLYLTLMNYVLDFFNTNVFDKLYPYFFFLDFLFFYIQEFKKFTKNFFIKKTKNYLQDDELNKFEFYDFCSPYDILEEDTFEDDD